MKTKLLFLFLLFPVLIFAQGPIANYYSLPNSNFALVNSVSPINQTATGGGLTWNFNSFTQDDTDIDTYASPTPAELTTFPGTTTVLTVTNTAMEENKIYTKDAAGQVSITGITRDAILLNYNSTNALIGNFPMSYGTTNSGPVAGDFTYEAVTGTFTGTITNDVDAYGTLNMNDLGEGAYSGSVTRLKTVQNLSLTALAIPNIGTATQTTYTYYDNTSGNLVFRSSDLTISVPLFGLNETILLNEVLLPLSTLDINENEIVINEFQIIPNPVEDVLNIHIGNNKVIKSILIADLSGRVVLRKNNVEASINVSQLQDGIYLLTVNTDSGVLTKKFIKK